MNAIVIAPSLSLLEVGRKRGRRGTERERKRCFVSMGIKQGSE